MILNPESGGPVRREAPHSTGAVRRRVPTQSTVCVRRPRGPPLRHLCPAPTLACENYQYSFQGRAERAVRVSLPTCISAAHREHCPARGASTVRNWFGASRTLARSRSPGLPLLGPAGPRRRPARVGPEGTARRTQRRQTNAGTRRFKRGHPSGALILKPCKFAVKPGYDRGTTADSCPEVVPSVLSREVRLGRAYAYRMIKAVVTSPMSRVTECGFCGQTPCCRRRR